MGVIGSSFTRMIVVVAVVFGGGCQRSSGSSGAFDASIDAAVARDWEQFPAVFTLIGASEIDAIGDLHGDIGVTARVLGAAGLITPVTPFHWTGGPRILVVTGDVIDKGTAGLSIIDLLMSLEPEARAAGGGVVVTLGNHEAEFLANPADPKSDVFKAELITRGLDPVKVAAGASSYGAWLRTRPVAALIDGWFFSHAGNPGGLAASAIARTFEGLFEKTASGDPGPGFAHPFVVGSDSLLEAQIWWNAGATGTTTATGTIDADLAGLPAQHIVFGHDPGGIAFPDDPQGHRDQGQLVTRYGGRIFLIDVGMSSAVGYSAGALLRILPGDSERATAIFADGTTQDLWP